MVKQKSSNPKGVLNPKEAQQHFTLKRFTPSDPVAFFVEHFWIVQWGLPKDKIFRQDVLSHPSVHLVFEEQNTKIYGVVTGKFTRELEGTGKVLGIKFRPGGFYPFYESPVSSFTDDVLAPDTAFETDIDNLEQSILSADPKRMAELAEEFLDDILPEKDEQVQQVNTIVEAIISDQTLIRVKQLAEQFGISKRISQRRFSQYVGGGGKSQMGN